MATVYGPWVTNEYNFRAILDYSTKSAEDRVYAYLTGRSQSVQTTINYGKSVLEYTEDGSNFYNMANVYPSSLGYGQTVTTPVPKTGGRACTVATAQSTSSTGSALRVPRALTT